jgi:hypothetical protein
MLKILSATRCQMQTLTSWISIQKFCCVVSHFSNFKRGLVTKAGFGGLMHLKITHKLNLKFSSSLMVRVDPDESILVLDQARKILITYQEINDAFGLPQGSRIIPPGHADLSEVCIEFSRLASSISTKGIHSLKAAEFIVSKPIYRSEFHQSGMWLFQESFCNFFSRSRSESLRQA